MLEIVNHIQLTSGNLLPNMHTVIINLTKYDSIKCVLFFTLTELWLMSNCKSSWYLETKGAFGTYDTQYTTLEVSFADPREATYFKISY